MRSKKSKRKKILLRKSLLPSKKSWIRKIRISLKLRLNFLLKNHKRPRKSNVMIKNMKLGKKKRKPDLITLKQRLLNWKKKITNFGMISKTSKTNSGNKNNWLTSSNGKRESKEEKSKIKKENPKKLSMKREIKKERKKKNSDNTWEKSNSLTNLLLTLTTWRVIIKSPNKRKKSNWLKLKSMPRSQLTSNGKKKKVSKFFNLKNQKKTNNPKRSTRRKTKRKNKKNNKKSSPFHSVFKLNSKLSKF